MSWNMEKGIHMMRGMARKSIFKSKSARKKRGATRQNMTENLNNCKEFALTVRSLANHFTTLMKSTSQKRDEKPKVPAGA